MRVRRRTRHIIIILIYFFYSRASKILALSTNIANSSSHHCVVRLDRSHVFSVHFENRPSLVRFFYRANQRGLKNCAILLVANEIAAGNLVEKCGSSGFY